jgi:hypothetical protein
MERMRTYVRRHGEGDLGGEATGLREHVQIPAQHIHNTLIIFKNAHSMLMPFQRQNIEITGGNFLKHCYNNKFFWFSSHQKLLPGYDEYLRFQIIKKLQHMSESESKNI